jgi:hypothetical protein
LVAADSGCREGAVWGGGRILRNAEDPQEEVVVLLEWDSLQSARRCMESATLRRKFEEAGVIADPNPIHPTS